MMPRARWRPLNDKRGSAVDWHDARMPELPEVETTRRGLLPHVAGRRVEHVLLRRPDLRFNDPRRFGCLLWQAPGETHALLAGLGPEPLSDDFDGAAFDGDYLFATSRGRKAPVKTFLMDQSVVVGVGNIYAAEALFLAGISPLREAGKVSRARYVALADAVKAILAHAIARGGTTLRDFISPDGAPGYFEQELLVYGRGGEPCPRCGRTLKQAPIGQRASVWCGHCQR